MDNAEMLTEKDLREYGRKYGRAAAASLLILTPADRFAGDYEAMLDEFAGE